MKTGEQLVALSNLPNGSALTHLAAITSGGGMSGLVFASQFYTSVSTPKHTYTQRAKRTAEAPQPVAQSGRTAKQNKNAYVVTSIDSGYIMSETDSLIILSVKR